MKKKIFGVGAALMDVLAQVSDEYLETLGSPKGGMTLVDNAKSQQLMLECSEKASVVAGGSACNTLVGISRLGGESSFVGKVGIDELGQSFESSIIKNGVTSHLIKSDSSTGRVVSLITPDAQRTMFTFLGASAEVSTENLKGANFIDCGIVHIEGYLAFNEPVFRLVLELAKAAGALVSLDLASFEVVQFKNDLLKEVIPKYVDILIANEDEAAAYCDKGLNEEEMLEFLSKEADIAVLKIGSRGSMINKLGEVTRVNAVKVDAIDTTGAGDLWAAGFLFGLSKQKKISICGEMGSIVASEVVKVIGAEIDDNRWDFILQRIKGL